MQVASQSMSFKCINNSKLNSNAFKSSTKFFSKLNKDAHDAMLNMIITFGSLHYINKIIMYPNMTIRKKNTNPQVKSSKDYEALDVTTTAAS